jgi:hypothetical protein
VQRLRAAGSTMPLLITHRAIELAGRVSGLEPA